LIVDIREFNWEALRSSPWGTVKPKVVAVSGGWDPLHIGHLKNIQDAAQNW